MDKGSGRKVVAASVGAGDSPASGALQKEFDGIVQDGVIKLIGGTLPEGTKVQIRAKRT
jgi:hypothetical protein